ncbi:MAG: 1-acyl-sn-glycerol-3-phosphate acyltransferase [Bacteroides sp.]|jgi:putative hemolysin|nr:1-acyl-sn-glycerol-3-phosphate acyltransferase [Bacteroides sp.]
MDDLMREEEEEPVGDFLDVDSVFRKKGKKIYPYIPKFIIRYLERIVHQDEMNAALRRLHHLDVHKFLEEILLNEFKVNIRTQNFGYLPKEGRYIVAGNHPLGGLDGMALMHVVGKKRKDFKFLANDILMELPNVKELFVPINKHGRNSYEAVRMLDELFRSDEAVLIFPAGLVSRKQKHGIYDLEWKKTFISKAIKYQRDIIPVHIDGNNSWFFYNLARWRKRLRIKANIEMLYLPDEMFRQKNKNITITFGEPVSYTTFTNALTHKQWAERMKAHVYGLPKGQLKFQV